MQILFNIKKCLFSIGMLLFFLTGIAQGFQKNIPLKKDSTKITITASFGAYNGNSMKAFAADIKKLLTLDTQIKVKDKNGNSYQVVSFKIAWKRKDQSEDIRTGKVKTVYYLVGADIKGNQLTQEWKEEINNFLQVGEELTLDTIIYVDPEKKVNRKAVGITITVM